MSFFARGVIFWHSRVPSMTILIPIVKVDVAVGGGIFVVFANGRRIHYSVDYLKDLKEN